MRRNRPQTWSSSRLRVPALQVPALPDLAPQAPVPLAQGRVLELGLDLARDQARVPDLDATDVIRPHREVAPLRGQALQVREAPALQALALRVEWSPVLLDRRYP